METTDSGQPPQGDLVQGRMDIEKVNAAGFDAYERAFALSLVVSLRYLQHLSSDLNRPMEDLDVEDILSAIKYEQDKWRHK